MDDLEGLDFNITIQGDQKPTSKGNSDYSAVS